MTQTDSLSRKIALRTFINEHGMREDATYDDLLRRDKAHVDEAAEIIASELAKREKKVAELSIASKELADEIAASLWSQKTHVALMSDELPEKALKDAATQRIRLWEEQVKKVRAALSGLGVK